MVMKGFIVYDSVLNVILLDETFMNPFQTQIKSFQAPFKHLSST